MARPRAARRLAPVLLAMLAVLVAGGALLFPTTAHAGGANGRLSRAELAPVFIPHNRAELARPDGAAASFNTLRLCARQLGHDLYPGPSRWTPAATAYRTLREQQVLYREFGAGRAARPGTSNHGLGEAVDLADPWMRAFIDARGPPLGWAKHGDAPSEWWHITHVGHFGHPNPGPGTRPVLQLGSGGYCQARWVRRAQRRLLIAVDGYFGHRTRRAVLRLQHSHYLRPDGIVGPATWRALTRPIDHRPGLPSPARLIDISSANGSIDWHQVQHANSVQGVYLKLTEGQDYRDTATTPLRLAAITAAHLRYGFYDFVRPRPRHGGCAPEIRWFVHVAKGLGGLGGLRPVLDVEVTQLAPAATARYVAQCARLLHRAARVVPVIYTGSYFWHDHVASLRIHGAPLWLACYCHHPHVPAPWRRYAAWQYTDHGSVPGVHGGVDVSYVPDIARLLTAKR